MSLFLQNLREKIPSILLTWGLAVLLSIGLRIWGANHPEPFVIRSYLVYALLFGPALVLAIWILLATITKNSS